MRPQNPAHRAARGILGERRSGRKHLTAEELEALLAAVRRVVPGQYDALLLLARVGLRVGELLALTWSHVHLSDRALYIEHSWRGLLDPTKSGLPRWVDLGAEATAMLDARRRPGGVLHWVFPSPQTGMPYSQTRVWDAMRQARTAAGITQRRSVHSLRHTFATIAIERGADPEWVQRQLGHASVATTLDMYASARRHRRLDFADLLDGK